SGLGGVPGLGGGVSPPVGVAGNGGVFAAGGGGSGAFESPINGRPDNGSAALVGGENGDKPPVGGGAGVGSDPLEMMRGGTGDFKDSDFTGSGFEGSNFGDSSFRVSGFGSGFFISGGGTDWGGGVENRDASTSGPDILGLEDSRG